MARLVAIIGVCLLLAGSLHWIVSALDAVLTALLYKRASALRWSASRGLLQRGTPRARTASRAARTPTVGGRSSSPSDEPGALPKAILAPWRR